MEIDKIIKDLNNKESRARITSSNPENVGLTEEEKSFIDTYKPEKSFIVYGTLAPNAPNHSVVEHIKGSWQREL